MNYAGLRGKLVEKDPADLPVAREDFYIRKSLDPRHVERLKQAILEGEELPPVITAYVKELGDIRIINGNHTAQAHRELKRPVRVFEIEGEFSYEDAIELQLELNPIENLPVSKEDLKTLAIRAYRTMRQVSARRERAEIIQRLALIFKKSERWIYHWLQDALAEEDRELKKTAIRLYKEGWTQEKIAREFGITQQTVSNWLSEIKSQSQVLQIFEVLQKFVKNRENLSSANYSQLTITKDFSDLMERYYEDEEREEGEKLEEWAKKKGIELDEEELKRLRALVAEVADRTAIETLKDTQDAYEKLLKERLRAIGFGTKTIKALMESLSGKSEFARKTAQSLLTKLEKVAGNLDLSEREVLAKVFEKVEHRELYERVLADDIKKVLSKYPVLTKEEIDIEPFYELREEELEQELKAQYPEHRIPGDLVEWLRLEVRKKKLEEERKRLEEEKAREEEERKKKEEQEKAKLSEIISQLKTSLPESLEVFLMSLSDEEKAIALKHVGEVRRVFESLPKANQELIEELAKAMLEGLTEEEVKEELRAKGFVPDIRPVLKRKEELIREKEEEIKRKEKELKAFADSAHISPPSLLGPPEGEAPPHFSNGEVINGQVIDEELDDELFELLGLEGEELEQEKGITLRGVRKKLEKILKLIKELDREMLSAKGKKALRDAIKECEETLEKIDVVFRRKERYTQEDKEVAKAVLMKFSEMWQEERGTELSAQEKAMLVKRVLEISGKERDKENIKERLLRSVEGFFEYMRGNEKRDERFKKKLTLKDFLIEPLGFEALRSPTVEDTLRHNLEVFKQVLLEGGNELWRR